jgi:hypothetical protein
VACLRFLIAVMLAFPALGATSHNLWPFEILMWGGASAVVMGVLALIKRLVR